MTDMVELQKKITLKATAPSTFFINLFASITHIGAGTSFFLFPPETRLHLVGIIPLGAWALVFIIHGAVKISFLPFTNISNWKYLRGLMLIAIFFDLWWLVEVLSAIAVNGFIGILVLVASLWFFLATIQIAGYIYFTPQIESTNRVTKKVRNVLK